MKWNELADEAKLELLEELVYIDQSTLDDCLVCTRAQMALIPTVAYAAGAIFSVYLEEGVLECVETGGYLLGHYSSDKDIPPYFKVL
ncbi:hypothetical protein D3C75_396230 [compost metagenome]